MSVTDEERAAFKQREMERIADLHPGVDKLLAEARQQGAQQERERMKAMRSDYQNLPHREFPAKWPDWREYEELLPTYCSCRECRLWRSGS